MNCSYEMNPILNNQQVLALHSGQEAVAYVPIEGVSEGWKWGMEYEGHHMFGLSKPTLMEGVKVIENNSRMWITCPFTPGKPVKCREEWRALTIESPTRETWYYEIEYRDYYIADVVTPDMVFFPKSERLTRTWQPPSTMPEAFMREYMVKGVWVEEMEGKYYWKTNLFRREE